MPPEPSRRGATASPLVTTRAKKTSATQPTSVPPARHLRSTSTESFAEASERIQSLEDAMKTLRKHQMVPAAGDPTAEGLVTGLQHVGVGLGNIAWASECCIALAIYAKAVLDNAATTLVGALEKRITTAGEQIAELTSELVRVGDGMTEKIATVIGDVCSAGSMGAKPGESSPVSTPFSYAAVARAAFPSATRATQISVADRESIRARQVLVDDFPMGDDGALTEVAILEKANDALDYLPRGVMDIPEGLRFTAARTLRNGGVILELATPALAKWVTTHAEDFASVLGERSKIRPRQYKLVA
ncbi:hypothetical protein BD311DRAFT_733385, partial [Dichomitus squalens]